MLWTKTLISTLIFFLLLTAFEAIAQKLRLEPVVQMGHSGRLNTISFSPNGKYIVTASSDGTARLWDVVTGLEIRSFRGHTSCTSANFSPNGKYIITAGGHETKVWGPGTAKLWDVSTGLEIRSFRGHTSRVNSASFSPNGQYIVTASDDETAKLWDVASGLEIRSFREHTSDLNSASFSPNGKYIVTASEDSTAKLWDVSTGRIIRSLRGHAHKVTSASFSPNGKYIITVSEYSYDDAKLWDVATGRQIRSISSRVTSASFSPNGKYIITVGSSIVKFWDVETGREIRTLRVNAKTPISLSPNGKYIVSCARYRDHTAILWDIATGREIRTFDAQSRGVTCVSFSPNGQYIGTGLWDGTVRLWDVVAGRQVRTWRHAFDSVSSLSFSPNGKYMVTGSISHINPNFKFGPKGNYGSAKLWDVETGQQLQTFQVPYEEARWWSLVGLFVPTSNATSFNPNGKYIVTSLDGMASLWDVASGQKIRSFGSANSVSFSPNGQYIVTGGYSTKLWDIASDQEIRTLKGHTLPVTAAIFSPTGKYIVTCSDDETAKLWDVASGREIRTFRGHTSDITAASFSPTGKNIVTGSEDNTARLWDVASGREIRTFRGHADDVNSLSVRYDSQYLVTGSNDKTLRIWEIDTGKELAMLVSTTANDWVVLTPSGLFDGTDKGIQDLVAWRIGNRVYRVDKFYDYYTPNLLARLFADERPQPKLDIADLNLPPDVRIIAPSSTSSKKRRIRVTATAEDLGGGIADVRLYQNGKLIAARKGKQGKTSTYTFEVELIPGDNVLKAVAFNRQRVESNEDWVRVVFDLPTPKTDLHLLVIGINEYEDPDFDLDYAKPDAEAIRNFFKTRGSRLFRSVYTSSLFNDSATKANILKELSALAKQARQEDVVMVYMAGHGVGLGQQYYFLPHEMRTEINEADAIRRYGIRASLLADLLRSIKALKQVLILDTCESGTALKIVAKAFIPRSLGAAERKAIKMLARSNGFFLIAAATKKQYAYEVPELGHGVLTYALLSGLGENGRPKAQITNDGIVTMHSLLAYVNAVVPELTEKYHNGEKQYPESFNTGMDFPLTVAQNE